MVSTAPSNIELGGARSARTPQRPVRAFFDRILPVPQYFFDLSNSISALLVNGSPVPHLVQCNIQKVVCNGALGAMVDEQGKDSGRVPMVLVSRFRCVGHTERIPKVMQDLLHSLVEFHLFWRQLLTHIRFFRTKGSLVAGTRESPCRGSIG